MILPNAFADGGSPMLRHDSTALMTCPAVARWELAQITLLASDCFLLCLTNYSTNVTPLFLAGMILDFSAS
jgi:hypothetical protein